MAMLRTNPEADVNTEDADRIEAALADVSELADLVNVKVGTEAYTMLPEQRAWVHQCWSGDVVNAQYYLPEGQSIEDIGYWKSPQGVIGSDAIAVLRDHRPGVCGVGAEVVPPRCRRFGRRGLRPQIGICAQKRR
ncbi:MAG: hypothetical protein ACR2HQ_08090 [Ilumatobacteraceae bacterium]